MSDLWPYSCRECGAEILAERFSNDPVTCSACGAGPFRTEHECCYDSESGNECCYDYLTQLENE